MQLEPVLAHMSVNYEGRLKVGRVDADEQPDLTAQFDVPGFPTILLFYNGEEVARQVGYGGGSGEAGLEGLSAWVDSNLPAEAG